MNSALLLMLFTAAPTSVTKAPASNAAFEGMLTFRLTMAGGQGQMRTTVAKAGIRTELALDFNGQRTNTVLVVRAQDPAVTWKWDSAKKAFAQATATREPSAGPPKVEVLADATVAGLSCKHLKISTPTMSTEYWTAPDFMKDGARAKFLSTAQRLAPEVEDALKAAGAFGLVVKSVAVGNRATTTFELEQVERVTIDPKAFDLTVKPE